MLFFFTDLFLHLSQTQLTIFVWVYFLALFSIPLIYFSILWPSNTISIIIALQYDLYQVLWTFSFFTSFSLYTCVYFYSSSIAFHINIRISLSISTKTPCYNFDWDFSKSIDQLEKNLYFKFVDYFYSLIQYLYLGILWFIWPSFQSFKLIYLVPFARFIVKYFIFVVWL